MSDRIFQTLHPGSVLGLIGVGRFGSELKRKAESAGLRTLLCDPPRCQMDAEELNDALHIDWGNGMGGCDFSQLETETFVPVEVLMKYADGISVQVPLNDSTEGMIDRTFLDRCRSSVTLWIFSDPTVVADDVRNDEHIRFCMD
ncbi:MAG: hypothetical protein J6Q65_00165 [Lentisphaeria bacterium]|nr:hypothetical protein [Lentisphaeria bacterium]